MLERKIYKHLESWRDSRREECLLVKGARQVGKTFAIRQFASKSYQSYIEVNFIEQPKLKDVFAGDLDPQTIKSKLSLYIPETRFIPHDTLLFLDEIQECPAARTSLKFLAQDHEIDVIASGSLLGIEYKGSESISVPVGYEKQIEMFPLDLEEFLWALGYASEALQPLRQAFDDIKPLPTAINELFLELTRKYMAIGGMPAVVQRFVDTKNYYDAYTEQRKILDSYEDDIAKYAPSNIRIKAKACYQSMPRQLAKENTKFQYGVVEDKGTARKFDSALDWLVAANLVHKCSCVSTPQFPLRAYERRDKFRLYLSDIGLLTAQYGFEMMSAVIDDTLTGPMKGGYYENLVACLLSSTNQPLYYWINDRGDYEIEFLIEKDARLCPIEVKSRRGATASLNHMLERDDIQQGFKLGAINLGKDGKKISLPLYMCMYLAAPQPSGLDDIPLRLPPRPSPLTNRKERKK